MRISEKAGAFGLIRIHSGETKVFERMIAELASQELVELFDLWLNRNQCQEEVIQGFVHRQIHRELIAFFVSVTERFANCHGVENTSLFVDAVADGARDASLADPRSHYPPVAKPAVGVWRAELDSARVERLRALYPYQKGEDIVSNPLVAESAWRIGLQLSVSPEARFQTDQSWVIGERLRQLANLLLRTPPYQDLSLSKNLNHV